MNFFAVVNELEVLVVALFMLCLSTLWYSSYLFGGVWEKETNIQSSSIDKNIYARIVATFFGYFVVLMGVAFLNALSQKMSLSISLMSFGFWMCVAGALVPIYVWEHKSVKLFLIAIGFIGVLINLGSYLLYAWN